MVRWGKGNDLYGCKVDDIVIEIGGFEIWLFFMKGRKEGCVECVVMGYFIRDRRWIDRYKVGM